jgi:RNA polymerase sigma factor (sigma-70 family)
MPTALNDEELLDAFLASRDPGAFTGLLTRHGPMVLRVCRDVLGDPHAAEDAFQATFVVLARRAAAIRRRAAVGVWLYGVARRVAVRAREQARRRARREHSGLEIVAMRESRPTRDEVLHGEIRPIVHDELGRLPAELRVPLVLCYFEGHTQESAAEALGCPLGTLKHRLSRGRALLRHRLSRRGVTVSALMLLLLLTELPPPLPGRLVWATACAAAAVGGDVSPAAALTARGPRPMEPWRYVIGRHRLAILLAVLLAALTAGGAAWVVALAHAREPSAWPAGVPARPVAGASGAPTAAAVVPCH